MENKKGNLLNRVGGIKHLELNFNKGMNIICGKFSLDKLEAAFGYPILTEESTVVKIILKLDMNPVLLNGIVGTR